MRDWSREFLAPPAALGPVGQLSAPCKLVAGGLLALWVVLVDRPVALALPLFVIGLCLPLERLRAVQWRTLLLGGLLILWSVMLSQGLFYQAVPREAVLTIVPPQRWGTLEFDGVRIFREGMLYGLQQSTRFITLFWFSLLVTFTTPLHLLLNALRGWRIPGSLGLLILVALRSVPTLAQEWLLLLRAMRLRRLSWRTLGLAGLLTPLTDRILTRGHTLAASLQLRGIDPLHPDLGPIPPLRVIERAGLLVGLLAVLVAIGARVLMLLYWRGWWYEPDWTGVYAVAAWLTSSG